MTGKTQAARQPSIDELLTSIRQAIQERVAPDASARSLSAEHTRPAAVPETGPEAGPKAGTEAGRSKRTIVTRGREEFAALLGGDVRLEEALARLNQPAWRRDADAPVAAKAANSQAASRAANSQTAAKAVSSQAAAKAANSPAAAPIAEPRLRPTIDDLGTDRARPAAGRWQRGEESASPGAPKRSAAEPADEVRKEARMRDYGAMSRPTERPAGMPAGAREGARDCARDGELLSSQAASAANSAFSRLNAATAPGSPRTERPLDEMTRECLRPLLKVWLDENLPGMVERLVREEIARVARRGS